MQDSLERLYQCFLWTAQFAESCRVYQKSAQEDKNNKVEKLFGNLANQYSTLSGNFLQMFQDAKDQWDNKYHDEIATEIWSFAGATDSHDNILRTLKNLRQFSSEFLPECAEICGQEWLVDISNQCRSILEMVKKDVTMLEA